LQQPWSIGAETLQDSVNVGTIDILGYFIFHPDIDKR